ncbi:uncharacterized protein LOC113311449 [Papaver somniferum]|uniref:uncharacterized protein LOC113311449 n=1 Tax=Papaver somniferum TaxID=3469 RepID=UPI000E7019BF|nr:uncharacterized protein LOC113311449 [Papaver somniferum]
MVRFSVLVNGSSTGYFKSKKRIRQGYPLSPFLFLLVGEALSYMIKQAQDQSLISGFNVADDGNSVSHLQFADDTLIFLDADIEQFSSILGCYTGVLPTTYLGLPLGDKSGGILKWDKVIESFLKKLAGWKKTILSRAASVAKTLEKIMRNFLWNDNKGKKKLHLVNWPALQRMKKYGGLGVKSLKKMNIAFLTKWLSMFANEDDVLWKKIIVQKNGIDISDWFSKVPKITHDSVKIKGTKVVEVYNADTDTWNLFVPRRLNSLARTELSSLQNCLNLVVINATVPDEICWSVGNKS